MLTAKEKRQEVLKKVMSDPEKIKLAEEFVQLTKKTIEETTNELFCEIKIENEIKTIKTYRKFIRHLEWYLNYKISYRYGKLKISWA